MSIDSLEVVDIEDQHRQRLADVERRAHHPSSQSSVARRLERPVSGSVLASFCASAACSIACWRACFRRLLAEHLLGHVHRHREQRRAVALAVELVEHVHLEHVLAAVRMAHRILEAVGNARVAVLGELGEQRFTTI